ncbi:4'-phosphopantetheinyl transferase superfamily protein [Terrimonas sp. NA20]|uniref:4'-phosphopantetheinyl transferase superfamily protein n=1 Tax=Terrimonas ginsenosidimutans TaxID=2908004 RepID=A0ABS9KWT2_9BACT|nr:4'-phosphopantetheinyl transferase superfamily protein [Terrimonas ginsenosidimutans]MCG2616829.1 4'-phosphopantetheinyl transferase superfamily protein [Terrimonas ginsenosidimutans]
MPIFFQHSIDETTRLGIWKIEENETFFKGNVPLHRDVTHPHKRVQHLAGRFLLQFLFADFPYHLVQVADTRKPYLPGEEYHFSISHCGDYAAAIVSKNKRVGVDIEIPVEKIERIRDKFLSPEEQKLLVTGDLNQLTALWSAKEAVFKWYGVGKVDFKGHIRLNGQDTVQEYINCFFTPRQKELRIHYKMLDQIVLAWVAD